MRPWEEPATARCGHLADEGGEDVDGLGRIEKRGGEADDTNPGSRGEELIEEQVDDHIGQMAPPLDSGGQRLERGAPPVGSALPAEIWQRLAAGTYFLRTVDASGRELALEIVDKD